MEPGFLKQQASALSHLISILDILIVLASFLLCHWIYLDDLSLTPERLLLLTFTLATTLVYFHVGSLYRSRRGMRIHVEITRLVALWGLVVLTVGLFAFLSKIAFSVSRMWFGLSIVTSLLMLIGFRVSIRASLRWLRANGYNSRSIVVVGEGELAELTLRNIRGDRGAGLRLAGFFGTLNPQAAQRLLAGVHTGEASDLAAFIEDMRRRGTPIDQVYLAYPSAKEESIQYLLRMLRNTSVGVCIVPGVYGLELLSGELFQVSDMPIVNLSVTRLQGIGEWLKALFDYLVAAIAVILLSPLLLMIALAIKIDSPGSILFKQRRYGIDGREITVWKFRTMHVQEDADRVVQATAGDDRVTRLGRFLRRTSLDELPQFFNVLQGSMSIVGPRPHAVAHNEEYRQKIDGYMMRHRIKPGITGWAQVNGWRGETDTLEKMRKRVEYDLYYIRHWSVWLDIKIVLLTLVRGFGGKNAY